MSESTEPTTAATGAGEEAAPADAAAESAAAAAPAAAEGKAEEGGDKKVKKRKRWFPLESNPDVMDKYLEGLGFPTAMYKCAEVLSTDDWALEMVPRPVIGVVMLFVVKEATEAHRDEEAKRIESEGQKVAEEVWYTHQTVGNACGTIGLLHAVANASAFAGSDAVPLPDDSWFSKFLTKTAAMNPMERAKALEDDEDLEEAHGEAASEGQTAVPDIDERVNAHFVAFSCVKGDLYELDGRKKFPINHGPSSPETLLQDSCKVVKQFMSRDPEEVRFTIVAIAANTE